ncbi:hypothetical protein DL96DRAFT_1605609 [Flagelloscypha sp. PMI_526]|nr:hypothetical protein DL96DRAFT_1605609 [Flagelloscypha sp. PMI_526]
MDAREQTLQALDAFIQRQTSLLDRTRADIALLQQLREQVGDSDADADDLYNSLGQLDVSLEEYRDDSILKQLQWTAFDGRDPVPLKTFSHSLKTQRRQSLMPPKTQQSALTPLQKVVKDARSSMVTPLLPTLLEQDIDTVHSLRSRRVVSCGGLTIPLQRSNMDETQDVDIAPSPVSPSDLLSTSTSRASTRRSVTPALVLTQTRTRRPSMRFKHSRNTEKEDLTPQFLWLIPPPSTSAPLARIWSKRKEPPSTATQPLHLTPPFNSKDQSPTVSSSPSRLRNKSGPKSETYKQAWSESEQNLLERLLDEIPPSEKNRWQRISIAMNGRRTPRQVASRVQKYFQKLAQYGIAPVGGTRVKAEGGV